MLQFSNRTNIFFGVLSVVILLCTSCDSSNACEEGFVQQYGPEGSTFCIPEFEEGMLNEFNLEDAYFHENFGVIRLENGVWRNQDNEIIRP